MTYSDQFLQEADPQNLLNTVMEQGRQIEELRQSILSMQRLSGIAAEVGDLEVNTVSFADGGGRLDDEGMQLFDAGDAVLFYDAYNKAYATLSLQRLTDAANVLRILSFTISSEDNLISNGDFETGDLSGWTVTDPNSVLSVDDVGVDSSKGLKVVSGGVGKILQSTASSFAFVVSFKFRVDSGTYGKVKVGAGFYPKEVTVAPSSGWRSCLFNIVYDPADPYLDEMYLEAFTDGVMYIDNILVRQVNSSSFGAVEISSGGLRVVEGSLSAGGFLAHPSCIWLGGRTAFSGVVSDTPTGRQDNYSPTNFGSANALLINPSIASVTITGLDAAWATTYPPQGRSVFIFNRGTTYNLLLRNENVNSSEGNRFAIGTDITIPPGRGVMVWYRNTGSSATSRWLALSV
ncbi:MAG: hypothetical protein EHM40_22155 [Chloroflexi bacterium]|nr:MAG: hypothetical protein EHM40_22155 [Chloroflexota bacterium]